MHDVVALWVEKSTKSICMHLTHPESYTTSNVCKKVIGPGWCSAVRWDKRHKVYKKKHFYFIGFIEKNSTRKFNWNHIP